MINGVSAVYVLLGLVLIAVSMVVAITIITIAGDVVPSAFEYILTTSVGAIVGAIGLNATPKNVVNTITGNSEKVE